MLDPNTTHFVTLYIFPGAYFFLENTIKLACGRVLSVSIALPSPSSVALSVSPEATSRMDPISFADLKPAAVMFTVSCTGAFRAVSQSAPGSARGSQSIQLSIVTTAPALLVSKATTHEHSQHLAADATRDGPDEPSVQ